MATRTRILFILFLVIFMENALATRGVRLKHGQFGVSMSLKNGGLFPSTFNVAAKADIYVNATCGDDGPETFCKPTEFLRCAVCDSRSPDPGKRHNITHVLDSNPGRWWQSPSLHKGERFEFITIILDLRQIYQIEYVILKAANSPRPSAWILEKSLDGENFQTWQYYAPSDAECWTRYSVAPVAGKPTYTKDDEVICTSFYSRKTPMESGEIHTHLVNGRPGAVNHSELIQEFTKARFVRIRLQSLRRNGDTIADKRRAFYSIKEINIGGRCICSGHASRCRYNVHHGHQDCECERHTCGEQCEKCCPMYNQIAWKSGTSGKGFHCEKCNCHGHATSCRFDPEVEEQNLSLDHRGKYKGGGVCLNCTEHTTGINCEKCEKGYYRPSGVLPDALEPCVPCDCNTFGGTGYCIPDDSFSQMGKVAGTCECKKGFSGFRCDQCAEGYRRFPDCSPCPCDERGSLLTKNCEGACQCKTNVNGEFCDRCKPGFFALNKDNIQGCSPCYCSGIVDECHSAKMTFKTVSIMNDWQVSDINGSRIVSPTLDTDRGWLTIAAFEVDYESPFWLAPKFYTGNRLSSYGSNFTFSVTWVVMRGDTSGVPTIQPNLLLIGRNKMRIAYGEERYINQDAVITVPLLEQGWHHVPASIQDLDTRSWTMDYKGRAVTKNEMLSILADVKYILVRAQYHSEQIEGSIVSAELPIGEITKNFDEKESLVEVCKCPKGYTGLSCEKCEWGYVKADGNDSNEGNRHECIKCDCNGHSSSCDVLVSECHKCEHNTIGPRCDRCAIGYYGDAAKGTPEDCKKCACPLSIASNNFSPNCQLEDPGNIFSGYVCTQCPVGYTGDHCESCDVGYFGNPLIPGGNCKQCPCGGGSCDQETGRCLECLGNTIGWSCEKCKPAHYGEPLERNCMPCKCDPVGSSSDVCDIKTGQCSCKSLFDGRDCSSCIEGYGNITAGCIECDCDFGSIDGRCDPITGECNCKTGVSGIRCSQCEIDHYGLSEMGCTSCRCNIIGSTSSGCDLLTGQCLCKPFVIGRQCDRCQNEYWGLTTGLGCAPCGCDPLGSIDGSCDDNSGLCRCKPGVGGTRCDNCLPRYYGFSENGCLECDPCDRLGHICDPDTGRCVCPPLTLGENCDRCRPGSYDLQPGIGCKSCACTPGSLRSQCLPNGQCPCRDGFDGLRCEHCAKGYYGYPKCRPCNCNSDGTLPCPNESGICDCDSNGQCPCKKNAIGRRCDQCTEGTFGLAADNHKGCTECFCFGRTTLCRQAGLSWGQRRLQRPRVLYINDTVNDIVVSNYGSPFILPTFYRGLNKTNGLTVIPETEGDVTFPSNLRPEYPLYWQLPKAFLADKVISYGGFLRFTTAVSDDGYPLPSSYRYPLVQIQGNNRIILEHYQHFQDADNNNNNNHYEVRFHESLWQLQNRPDFKVTREILMVALQNLQNILLRATDYTDFSMAALLHASMDAAVLTPTHSPPLATGIEICECPPEYNSTSCQDPSIGFYRWHENNNNNNNNTNAVSTIVIDLVGKAKRCQCSGRSEICHTETGYCLNCRENTAGPNCNICAESYHGDPNFGGCKACPCPQYDKKFSTGCKVLDNNDVVCRCKNGYTGPRCERCSYGYYGFPNIPGGSCKACNCNSAGSASDECDQETGQCNCKSGSTGRDCSECTAYRHVFIDDICTSCNDNCTGLLLDDLEFITNKLELETEHISMGEIPAPWEQLFYIDSNVTIFSQDLKQRKELQGKLETLPRHDFKKLLQDSEKSLHKSMEEENEARILKIKSDELQNNVTNIRIEFEENKKKIRDIISQLIQYGNENKKIRLEHALKEANLILENMKIINFPNKRRILENMIEEFADYIEWLNSLYDPSEELKKTKKETAKYREKLEDLEINIEKLMETFFTYDGLYTELNKTYNQIDVNRNQINNLNSEINEWIKDGKELIAASGGCVIDAENNFQDFPEMQKKLNEMRENLKDKEEIIYRLNFEYENKFVIPAVDHARNLSDYADRYVDLFSETRNQAANPLKASQAYKNIYDNLQNAENAARETNKIADDVYEKVYPNGPDTKSLIDVTGEMLDISTQQLDKVKEYIVPLSKSRQSVEMQKQSVTDLKNSLNNTGNKDNEINIKLRELHNQRKKLQEDLQLILSKNENFIESIQETRRIVDDYKEGIANGLRPKLHELKREGDSKISLASEQLTEAQNNIKRADEKLLSLATASAKRQQEFDKWNGTLAEKLQKLKNKIVEAKNSAHGIRISLKSADGKKCIRSYRPGFLQPSSTTTIVMTFAVAKNKKEGSLFYLPSGINDDFMALEMIDRKIRFIWNVGGGTGFVTHPEILESGDYSEDNFWYRIEAERTRNVGKLNVHKQISMSGNYLPQVNSTSVEFGRFDVLATDRIWLGGVPESQRRPSELLATNGLPGCVHQVILDGKTIGLWNFVSTAPDMACQACVEGVEDPRDDIAYSFNGEGYAVRNRVTSGPYNKYTFGISLSFRTFDENALLFLAINPKNNQHVMIFLREGRVFLHIGYGGNVSMEMYSNHKYNTGNWTKVDAFRQYQSRKNIEKCILSVGGDNDKKLVVPTPQPKKEDIPDFEEAKYYIGGVPPSFRNEDLILPRPVSFLGCMSNIVVQEGYDPLAEKYYGIEPSCGNRPLRIVGFYGDGYLEHSAISLKKISSTISFSFRTLQKDAMILLSTFQGQEEKQSTNDSNKDNYYSIVLIKGHIQVRLNGGKGEIIVQSNETYNDGKYHSILISKKRKEIELRVDDSYQGSGKLPTGTAIKAPDTNGGLYFGGLPALINNTKMVSTAVPLYGAIRDVLINEEILRFDEVTNFDHAQIGRSGPNMGKDPPIYVPSASLSRGMSTQPEGCQKVPYYSLEPGALKFGDKSHSHTQFYIAIKKFWEKKYAIEFDFRTYYPNGILFITPGIKQKPYLMVVLRDGQLSLQIKARHKKEIIFKSPLNDGNWHHVVIRHEERKLTLIVDSQTPRTIKIPRKIGLASMMYIGGLPESGTPLPEQAVAKLETLKGCIRGLRLNGNIFDMVGSTSRAYNVGQCFPNVESGAYFQDEAYAIYKKDFKLEGSLELELEFKTSELSGVLLSITAPSGSPSMSLELNNGKVIMSADLGDNNPLYVEQRFSSSYTVCDNRWHKIQAVYNDEELALKVDDLDQKYGLPANINYHSLDDTAASPLYIGGLPATTPKGTLMTRDHFNGCIRNVMIGGERRDWTDMTELHNIHLSSCPVQ
ncbi:laminin subunit alpha-1 isoform X1 [Leptopilina boulardi]|uniref:laminin subunit alpha-1 isoform X1 n=2 Tax=Leptopilina boulardi TaxID=63433 RepID=UPI0021F55CA2|nr:laminin subunit alpha-1 isoform X1 [Leptopilina boulardi]